MFARITGCWRLRVGDGGGLAGGRGGRALADLDQRTVDAVALEEGAADRHGGAQADGGVHRARAVAAEDDLLAVEDAEALRVGRRQLDAGARLEELQGGGGRDLGAG